MRKGNLSATALLILVLLLWMGVAPEAAVATVGSHPAPLLAATVQEECTSTNCVLTTNAVSLFDAESTATPTATPTPASGDCEYSHCGRGEREDAESTATPTATPTPASGDCEYSHCGRIKRLRS